MNTSDYKKAAKELREFNNSVLLYREQLNLLSQSERNFLNMRRSLSVISKALQEIGTCMRTVSFKFNLSNIKNVRY